MAAKPRLLRCFATSESAGTCRHSRRPHRFDLPRMDTGSSLISSPRCASVDVDSRELYSSGCFPVTRRNFFTFRQIVALCIP